MKKFLAIISCLTVFLDFSHSQSKPTFFPEDQYWSYKFAHPGLFNRARYVEQYNSNSFVFAGHNFETPAEDGQIETYLLAFWDGTGWKIDGPGRVNDFVGEAIYDMCVVGTDIYIGGNFTTLNSEPISYLAKWDGTNWSQVGSGVDGPVWALETDGNFNLYAGGAFTHAGGLVANRIAKWDGTSWFPLDEAGGLTNGVNGLVRSIAIGNTGIYVGGDFTVAGGTNAYYAALYNTAGNPDTWEDLDILWTVGNVYSIDFANNTVFIGGGFFKNNGWPGNGIIKKEGNGNWEAMGSGSPLGVYKLVANTNGEVFAVGDFTADAGPAANQIAKWNGTMWETLGNERFNFEQLVDIALYGSNTIYTTRLNFENSNYLYGNRIYKWDGFSWSGLGEGVGDYWTSSVQIKTLAWYNSKLITGGNFSTAGDKYIKSLAQLNPSGWSDVGGNSVTPNNFINKLLVHNNKLYAAGYFTNMGGTNANNIAVWDGSSWSNLGSGVDNFIETIHFIGDDIYVTGPFFIAGGSTAIGYAKWNGNNWQALANGGSYANAMTNIGNDLYVGGQFTSINAGTVSVNNLARWDGSSWSDVGGGVSQGTNFSTGVFALASRGNELIVGGNFTLAGSTPANNIAIWNGLQWNALGEGLNGIVRTILVSGNDIYVGGQFTTAGANTAFSIARWDGTTWYPLGRGINQSNNFVSIATVYSLLPTPDGLYVGGQFTHAGDKYSNMIALYTDFTTTSSNDVYLNPSEFNLFQNYPNPYNPNTKILYVIPNEVRNLKDFSSQAPRNDNTLVTLKVYDILGNEIATLVDEYKSAGSYEVEFDASSLSSGVYFYRITIHSDKLQSGSFVETKKMILLK
jgi:hypothetical protein